MNDISILVNEVKNGKLSAQIEFLGKVRFSIEIETLSGMLIAGGVEEIEIGKIDKIFIRDPITNLPYIPGSSLKGVMRSMLEYKYGKIAPKGAVHVCNDPECPICRVFGTSEDSPVGPTRIHVIDGLMSEETKKILEGRGLWSYVEFKTENYINRVFGKAESPRTFERVPPGSKFNVDIDYLVFSAKISLAQEDAETPREVIDKVNSVLDWKKDIEYIRYVLEGLVLAENHGLGASISRGYGKIRITIKSIEVRNLSYYNEGKEPLIIPLEEIVGKKVASPRELLEKFDLLKNKLLELFSKSS